jgi:hypothetical protein
MKCFAFLGCVGCVDGCYISIKKPPKNYAIHPEAFFNRKGSYSLNMLAFTDADKRIRYYESDSCGSRHDSTVFRESELNAWLQRWYGDRTTPRYVLADLGYACEPFILTPYPHPKAPRDGGPRAPRRPWEAAFNKSLKKSRVTVEHTFG